MVNQLSNNEYNEILQQLVAEIKNTRVILAKRVNNSLR